MSYDFFPTKCIRFRHFFSDKQAKKIARNEVSTPGNLLPFRKNVPGICFTFGWNPERGLGSLFSI